MASPGHTQEGVNRTVSASVRDPSFYRSRPLRNSYRCRFISKNEILANNCELMLKALLSRDPAVGLPLQQTTQPLQTLRRISNLLHPPDTLGGLLCCCT